MTMILWLLLLPIALGTFALVWKGLDPDRLTVREDFSSYLEWLRGNDA